MLALADQEQERIDALASGAIFSPCRRWRYLLWRRWDDSLPTCVFIGLNPSTADELKDDPTIRRCRGFAREWGYGALHMLNIFAWRATKPADMKRQGAAAVGPRNSEYLRVVSRAAGLVVAAWGVHGDHLGRGMEVRRELAGEKVGLHVLRFTAGGAPGHPLYAPGDLEPVPWLPPPNAR